ncbi:MAG: M23 family metallopeptidase [Chloroflexi bacterium]|nr:M23 family metallopeptidase [Chloroflexota bacterium]
MATGHGDNLRPLAVICGLLLPLMLAAACGSASSRPTGYDTPLPTLLLRPTATATATPTLVATPTLLATPTPTVFTGTSLPPVLSGFVFPIEGACIPTSDNLLPNAPRPYRAGVHEGVDFYDGLACASVFKDMPVLAAKAGLVIRADRDYVPLTAEEVDELLTRSQTQGYTDEEALDRFRGRQVWIEHGGGIVTRYAHLDGIAPGIKKNVWVAAGQVIGYVGNSGTPESVTDPNAEVHLHFEIRVADSYLGQGLPIDQVRALLDQAFSP